MAKQPQIESPLKQVNQAGAPKRSKLDQCWHDLSHLPTLFTAGAAGENTATPPPKRYFSELFCLRPSRTTEEKALASLSNEDLLGPYKDNISLLFIHAVRTLKEATSDNTCRSHALETLFPLLRNVLGRRFEHPSHDIVNVLAGSLDESNTVFANLVSAIDAVLQDQEAPAALRHRTLQLALLIVSTVGQGSLVAYFLRRDLFSTLVAFIADPETKMFAFEATLLLGLLANYRKCEARNPYGVRIEDFVEEGVMERMIDVVATVCTRTRDSYLAVSDDAPPTLVGSLTSFVSSLRLGELLGGGFYLPPAPPAPARQTTAQTGPVAAGGDAVGEEAEKAPLTAQEKGKGRATEQDEDEQPNKMSEGEKGAGDFKAAPAFSDPSSSTAVQSAPSTSSSTSTATAAAPTTSTSTASSDGAALPADESVASPAPAILPRPTPSRTSSGRPLRPEDAAYAALPPAMTVLLLPFYELLDANKTFCSLVYNDRIDGTSPTLPVELISLVSYMVCHASLSARARVYSRLAFCVLMILVEEGEGKLTLPRTGGEPIRLCRQRAPQLPLKDASRSIPFSAMIDTVVLFLRHNLRRRLEVETYTIALRLLQRTFQQLKNEHCKLNRDWVIVWRSLLSLAGFIVSHRDDLRHLGEALDALISQLFVTLAYAAYWSEQLLPDGPTQAHLYYELLHADETLGALSDLLGASATKSEDSAAPASDVDSASAAAEGTATPTKPAPATSTSTSTYPYLSRRETASQSGFLSLHSTLSNSSPTRTRSMANSFPCAPDGSKESARFVATECIANLRSTITFFSGHLAAYREEKRAKNASAWWPFRRAQAAPTSAEGGQAQGGGSATEKASAPALVAAAGNDTEEDHLEPDEILQVIEAHVGAVELIESAAMGDLPRYATELDLSTGSRDARFWEEVVEVACRDTEQLLQGEPPAVVAEGKKQG